MATTPANTHDFNGDGLSDQLFWNNGAGGDNTVEFWDLQNGQTNPEAVVLGTVNPAQYYFLGTGDFNGDGVTDIAWQSRITPGDVIVWEMDENGDASAHLVGHFNPATYQPLAVGDFNDDGTSDIVFQNISGVTQGSGDQAVVANGWVIWNFHTNLTTSGAAVSGFANPSTETAGRNFGVQAAGEYDQGGPTDLLLRLDGTPDGNYQIMVPLWNGAFYTLGQQELNLHLTNADAAGGDQLPFIWNIYTNLGTTLDNPDGRPALVTPIGDLNGDGTQDILWVEPHGGVEAGQQFQLTTEFMNGGEGSGLQVMGEFTFPDWALVGTGDYNGDNTTDLVFDNRTNDAIEAWNIQNGIIQSTPVEGLAAGGWHLIA
jgi:hypothetical protein